MLELPLEVDPPVGLSPSRLLYHDERAVAHDVVVEAASRLRLRLLEGDGDGAGLPGEMLDDRSCDPL